MNDEPARIADAFFEDVRDAMREARRRRSALAREGFATKVEESPYGGYRVRSMPAEFLVEMLADGIPVPYDRHGRLKTALDG